MLYKALHITIDPYTDKLSEIVSAMLDSFNFEGISEENGLIKGYIPVENFDQNIIHELRDTFALLSCSLSFKEEDIPEQNWNHIWESNFEPVIIADKCVIRAPFHPEFENIEYRITIEPKMSFGTGHHQTTRLMIESILEMDVSGKKILDMGCGTGVLSILASMRGAGFVTAVDIDQWAFENTLENTVLNAVKNIDVLMGGVEAIPVEKYDIILANINRNILLEQFSEYHNRLVPDGSLIISGILEEDILTMFDAAERINFAHLATKNMDNWAAMIFKRK